MRSFLAAAIVVLALVGSASPGVAATRNIVVNGDFERGDLTGWTTDCSMAGNVTGLLGAADRAINEPSRWGIANIQGQVQTSCTFYQTITIPAGATSASLQMRYGLTGSNFNPGGDVRRIDITDASGATSLRIIQAPVGRGTTRGLNPLATPLDLTALAGQTIRLQVQLTHLAGSTSANVVGLDDVALTVVTPDPVPTLSEWAMILFGLTLAGGAAVTITRRRQLAA